VVLLKGVYSTLKYKAILNNFLTRVEEGHSIQCPMKTDKKTNNSQQNTTQKLIFSNINSTKMRCVELVFMKGKQAYYKIFLHD